MLIICRRGFPRIFRICLSLFLLLWSAPLRADEGMYFLNFSTKDGLSQATVTAIAQDGRGYMWLGTRNGLNRYNGYRFEVFKASGEGNAISDNNINAIVVDTEGFLWVGTNEGLNRIDPLTLRVEQFFCERPAGSNLLSNHIVSLAVDGQGTLWVGTRSGACRYDPRTGTFIELELPSREGRKLVINAIAPDGRDNIYLATNEAGLIACNTVTGRLRRYTTADSGIRSNGIRHVFADASGRVWIGCWGQGIDLFDPAQNAFLPIGEGRLRDVSEVRSFCQDPQTGDMVVGSRNGLWIVDGRSLELRRHYQSDGRAGSLSYNSVFSVFMDSDRSLWIGSYWGGVDFYSPYAQLFRFVAPLDAHSQPVGTISQMVPGDGDEVYIGTEGSGLLRFDPATHDYRIIPVPSPDRGQNYIKSLLREGNTIWCGTSFGSLFAFDIPSQRYRLIRTLTPARAIYSIARDAQGNLVLGCVNEPGLIVTGTGGAEQTTFATQTDPAFSFSNARSFAVGPGGEYLVGTRNTGLFRYDPLPRQMEHYGYNRFDTVRSPLGSNYVTDIFRSPSGGTYVCTNGGGVALMDVAAGTFDPLTTRDGLLSDYIYTVREDAEGYLWASTDRGLSKIDFRSRRVENYSYPQQAFINEFAPNSGIACPGGTMIFGGINGLLCFNPAEIRRNPAVPPVYIESVYIKSLHSPENSREGSLQRVTVDGRELVLRHNQRDFSVEFASLNYVLSPQNEYSYRLEGFDRKWSPASGAHMAAYTNIPAGKYTFRVIASNNDGVWNEQGARLQITVLPHPLLSVWAILCYALLAGAFVFWMVRSWLRGEALKARIAEEQLKTEVREEFHRDRLKLFSNFSHEIRTPLSLIIGPLDDYVTRGELDVNFPATLRLMQSNAHRMMRIVNNLMDFSKNESGRMRVHVAEGDLAVFSEEMYLAFTVVARSREIDFRVENAASPLRVWFDEQLMEKVFFNLLSNAFKNTPDGGAILIRTDRLTAGQLSERFPQLADELSPVQEAYALVEVIDDGLGIEPADLEAIFQPFFQTARTEHAHSGTGIGLSLTKSIVELHHGAIRAGSDGRRGVAMRFAIPLGRELYLDDQIAAASNGPKPAGQLHETVSPAAPDVPGEVAPAAVSDGLKYKVLVIEDNADVRNYLAMSLSGEYEVLTASNGEDGLARARNHMPDIILTDLMMPRVDGIELTRTLKGDIYTSHIPIIILSARTSLSQIQEGYAFGADDYIIKPFNIDLVRTRIRNTLDTREKLKRIYSRKIDVESLGLKVTSVDEVFIQKIYALMEANIAKTDLSLDDLASQIGMSRSSLYRKMKAVINITPNEFIRNFRLEMAARLLESGKVALSDVYAAVGFNSQAYFSHCFKKLYHKTPSEYSGG